MKITEGDVFPVGPSEKYSNGVERALGTLEKNEKSAARELKNAGKRTTQVAATSKLGTRVLERRQVARQAQRQPGRRAR